MALTKRQADQYSADRVVSVAADRILENWEVSAEYYELWLVYPDLMIDFFTPKNSTFKLFFYQRIYLRACFRYRYFFATFTRAFSKSFLAILALILRCILLPGSKVFLVAETKEQAASIFREKFTELLDLLPFLRNELSTKIGERPNLGKDYARITFKNGSILDVVAALSSTRGGRRHAGLLEEVILMDGDKVSEIIIPLMNVARRMRSGRVNPHEPNRSQMFVTSAGYKGTFAYEKLLEVATRMAISPEKAFFMGGSYKIPVLHDLISQEFIDEIMDSETFKESSFAREYVSQWSGGSDQAFYDHDSIQNNRVIVNPEWKANYPHNNEDCFYIMAIDVARTKAETAILIIKVLPQENFFIKKVVNIFIIKGTHFEQQAAEIKKLEQTFDVKEIIIDANGIGRGLLDFMIINSSYNGETFGPIGVINIEDYEKIQPKDAPKKIFGIITGSNDYASNIHINLLNQISSGKIKFLYTEGEAKTKLLSMRKGEEMTISEKLEYMKPFILTTEMQHEIVNLRAKENVRGAKIELERISRSRGKDKFSALEYGIWRIKEIEEKYYLKKKKKKRDLSSFITMG